jgi:hypothetical protein
MTETDEFPARRNDIGDDDHPSVAKDANTTSRPLPDQQQEELFREIKEIGWPDKEILGRHHHVAVRIWWAGKVAPALIEMMTGDTPLSDPANDN